MRKQQKREEDNLLSDFESDYIFFDDENDVNDSNRLVGDSHGQTVLVIVLVGMATLLAFVGLVVWTT